MRIHTSVPTLVLAALLSTTLIGCQRQESTTPKSEFAIPSGEKLVLPGGRDAVGPQQMPAPKPALIAI